MQADLIAGARIYDIYPRAVERREQDSRAGRRSTCIRINMHVRRSIGGPRAINNATIRAST